MSFNSPVLRWAVLVRNLKLATVINIIIFNTQVHSWSMNGFNFPNSVPSCYWNPLLVCSTGLVPLNDFWSTCCFFLCDIKALTIQDTLKNICVSCFNPFPSLIESFIFLVLNESFSVFKGACGDINSFAWLSINKNARFIEGSWVVNWNNIEKLAQHIRVMFLVSKNTFKSNSLGSFGWS